MKSRGAAALPQRHGLLAVSIVLSNSGGAWIGVVKKSFVQFKLCIVEDIICNVGGKEDPIMQHYRSARRECIGSLGESEIVGLRLRRPASSMRKIPFPR